MNYCAIFIQHIEFTNDTTGGNIVLLIINLGTKCRLMVSSFTLWLLYPRETATGTYRIKDWVTNVTPRH